MKNNCKNGRFKKKMLIQNSLSPTTKKNRLKRENRAPSIELSERNQNVNEVGHKCQTHILSKSANVKCQATSWMPLQRNLIRFYFYRNRSKTQPEVFKQICSKKKVAIESKCRLFQVVCMRQINSQHAFPKWKRASQLDFVLEWRAVRFLAALVHWGNLFCVSFAVEPALQRNFLIKFHVNICIFNLQIRYER